MLGLTNEI
jgi:antitoxin ParD1/3/4